MKIKNWSEFQHFKDRTPPWIKLYRYLLDDPEWHALSGDDAKHLVMLWLIASEDKDMQGTLPDVKKISFRLRITEKQTNQLLTNLSNWLIHDDIDMISNGYQDDAPEERREERETKTEYNPPIPDELLKEWLAVRKKKPVTERVFNSVVREANKIGWTPEQAIIKCCERGWTGFEASWIKVEEKQQSGIKDWI